MNIYEFDYTDIKGNHVSMSKYQGRVLLIVNVASKCGFTKQYEGLEKLYKDYKSKGFDILAFPSNQFGEQEPWDNYKIVEFCQSTYNVSFDMSSKVEVRGDKAIPLYKYLVEQQGFVYDPNDEGRMAKMYKTLYATNEEYKDDQIKWNFTKFLIGKDGEVVQRFEPSIEPSMIASAIEQLL